MHKWTQQKSLAKNYFLIPDQTFPIHFKGDFYSLAFSFIFSKNKKYENEEKIKNKVEKVYFSWDLW